MKKLIASTLLAATLLGGAGVAVTATAANAANQCGPDAAEELRRPGGYCELLAKGGSLASPGEPAPIMEAPEEVPPEEL